MRCTSPLFRLNNKKAELIPPFLKRKIYNYKDYFHYVNNLGVSPDIFLRLNCGQCLSCRINKAREWSERCYLESKNFNSNYFVTLTYNDSSLPFTSDNLPTLKKRDVQLFWKRLRKWCSDTSRPSPRYFVTGEYGELNYRPHYHAIIFNLELPDLVTYKISRKGRDVFVYQNSAILEKLWGKGFCVICKVTPETCSYTAQYSLKKVGMKYDSAYALTVLSDNSASDSKKFNARCSLGIIEPPFNMQSSKPGLGGAFCLANISTIFETDKIPSAKISHIRYFDKLLERANGELFSELKDKRLENIYLNECFPVGEENQLAVNENYVLKSKHRKQTI